MPRPASRLPALLAILVMVLGLVAPLAVRTAAGAGLRTADGAGTGTGTVSAHEAGPSGGARDPGAKRAESAGHRALPTSGAKAVVRAAADPVRSPMRPLAPVAMPVAAAVAGLALAPGGAPPPGSRGAHRRWTSPLRRRGPPAPAVP